MILENVYLSQKAKDQVQQEALDWVHTTIWEIFSDLKRYKMKQDTELKAAIEADFDELCNAQTSFATLNQALKRLASNAVRYSTAKQSE